MDSDEVRKLAAAAGLEKVEDRHLQQLKKSFEKSRLLTSQMPRDLHWSEEVAFTFQPKPRQRAVNE
jgi:hypothetical protein